MPTNEESRPAGNGAASKVTSQGCAQYIAGIRRRRAATYRLPALDCGHADPWTCKCHDDTDESTGQYIDGYRDAAQHLMVQGLTPAPNLPAMRGLWRRGGADRDLVRGIAERWEVAG